MNNRETRIIRPDVREAAQELRNTRPNTPARKEALRNLVEIIASTRKGIQ